MDIVAVEYRGFVITHPAVSIRTAGATVQVASDHTHLLSRLLGQHVFEDPRGQERAIAKAKRYIDVILGDPLKNLRTGFVTPPVSKGSAA